MKTCGGRLVRVCLALVILVTGATSASMLASLPAHEATTAPQAPIDAAAVDASMADDCPHHVADAVSQTADEQRLASALGPIAEDQCAQPQSCCGMVCLHACAGVSLFVFAPGFDTAPATGETLPAFLPSAFASVDAEGLLRPPRV